HTHKHTHSHTHTHKHTQTHTNTHTNPPLQCRSTSCGSYPGWHAQLVVGSPTHCPSSPQNMVGGGGGGLTSSGAEAALGTQAPVDCCTRLWGSVSGKAEKARVHAGQCLNKTRHE